MARSNIPVSTISAFCVTIANLYAPVSYLKGKAPKIKDTKLEDGKTVEFERDMTDREGFEVYLIEVFQTFVGQYNIKTDSKDWKPSTKGLKSTDGVEIELPKDRPETIMIKFAYRIRELEAAMSSAVPDVSITVSNMPALVRDWMKKKLGDYNTKLRDAKLAA